MGRYRGDPDYGVVVERQGDYFIVRIADLRRFNRLHRLKMAADDPPKDGKGCRATVYWHPWIPAFAGMTKPYFTTITRCDEVDCGVSRRMM